MSSQSSGNRFRVPVCILVLIGLASMFVASFVYRLNNPSLEEVITITSHDDQPAGFGGGGGMGAGLSAKTMSQVSELMAKLQEDPESYTTRMQLAGLFIEVNNWAGAAAHLVKAAELHPQESMPVYMLGVCLFRMNDFEGAAKCFEQVLKLEDDPLAKFNLALLYRKNLGKVAESDTLLHALITDNNVDKELKEQAQKVLDAPIPK